MHRLNRKAFAKVGTVTCGLLMIMSFFFFGFFLLVIHILLGKISGAVTLGKKLQKYFPFLARIIH